MNLDGEYHGKLFKVNSSWTMNSSSASGSEFCAERFNKRAGWCLRYIRCTQIKEHFVYPTCKCLHDKRFETSLTSTRLPVTDTKKTVYFRSPRSFVYRAIGVVNFCVREIVPFINQMSGIIPSTILANQFDRIIQQGEYIMYASLIGAVSTKYYSRRRCRKRRIFKFTRPRKTNGNNFQICDRSETDFRRELRNARGTSSSTQLSEKSAPVWS